MESRPPESSEVPFSGKRLTGGVALGLAGAALGLGAWLGVTMRTGQYRAFLATGVALGVALGVRLVAGRGGVRAQLVGLGVSLPAIALGQYLAICLLWRDVGLKEAALKHSPPPGLLVGFDRFVEGWVRLWDPRREAIFLVVSLVTVLWLLRRRRIAPRP